MLANRKPARGVAARLSLDSRLLIYSLERGQHGARALALALLTSVISNAIRCPQ